MGGMSYYDLMFQRVGQMTISVLIVVGLIAIGKLCYDWVVDWYENDFSLKRRTQELVSESSYEEFADEQVGAQKSSFFAPQTYAGKLRSVPAKDE